MIYSKVCSSWEKIKARLDPLTPGRFPGDWEKRVEKLKTADYPITFAPGHLTGFFSFLRELCGDNCYYLFYDEPELVHEIMEFQVYRLTTLIKKVSESINIDKHFIWEDMCFNKGPLISPELFKEFLLKPYQRVIEVSKQCGIQIIDVDSDGKVDELLPLPCNIPWKWQQAWML